jgi:AcrR family transcriptional regulator
MKNGKSSTRRKRVYRQSLRAEAAVETRQRILEVTRQCLARLPIENVGLEEVAARARVARSTIYKAFGSRQGLMVALAEDLLRRGGFDQLGRAFRNPDPRVALESSLREGVRLYTEIHDVARAILTLSALDPDVAHGAARFEFGRKEGMADLARRLGEKGELRKDMTEAEAADVLWVATSYDTFRQLYEQRGLTPEETASRIIAIATRTICRPGVEKPS